MLTIPCKTLFFPYLGMQNIIPAHFYTCCWLTNFSILLLYFEQLLGFFLSYLTEATELPFPHKSIPHYSCNIYIQEFYSKREAAQDEPIMWLYLAAKLSSELQLPEENHAIEVITRQFLVVYQWIFNLFIIYRHTSLNTCSEASCLLGTVAFGPLR